MTPSEILKKECEDIVQRTGIYIPPYRFANIMRTATKIAELITKSDIFVSYTESLLIMKIVMKSIGEITGEEV